MSKVITSDMIDAAVAAGQQRVDLPAGAVITPAARDRARQLGVALGNSAPESPAWQRGNGNGNGHTVAQSTSTSVVSYTQRSVAPAPPTVPAAPAAPSAPAVQQIPYVTPAPSNGNWQRPEGWSAPFLSSPYTPPPHPMERARMIIVEFEADEQAMRDAVPYPLELVPGSTAVAFVGENRQMPTALNFHEGSVVLKVRLGDYVGNFTPYIWTSTDEPMLAGREVSGRPKLMCDATPMVEEGNFVHTKVIRRGQTLMDIGVSITQHGSPKSLPLRGGWLSVRKTVMPERGRPSLKQVVYHELSDSLTVNWIWEGRGQLDLPPTALSAVGELRPKRILRAWYAELGWFLGWGKIAWEAWVPQEDGDPYYETLPNGNGHGAVAAPAAPAVAAPARPQIAPAGPYQIQTPAAPPENPGATPAEWAPGAPEWKGRPYTKALDTAQIPWKRINFGLYQKVLSRDPDTKARTALAWAIPDEGYQAPKTAHYHNTYEEIIIVHGSLSFNSVDWLTRGAYCWHAPRTIHGFKSKLNEPAIFLSRVGRDLDVTLVPEPLQQTGYNLDGPIEEMSRPFCYVFGLKPDGWEDVRDASGKLILSKKILSQDKVTGEGTMLLRLPPGWQSPHGRHYHRFYQEMFIFEGELTFDDGTKLLPMCYKFRPPYVIEGKASSEKGALVYMNYGGKLDYLPA